MTGQLDRHELAKLLRDYAAHTQGNAVVDLAKADMKACSMGLGWDDSFHAEMDALISRWSQTMMTWTSSCS
eukprot:181905-Amphidinium_carterae.1